MKTLKQIKRTIKERKRAGRHSKENYIRKRLEWRLERMEHDIEKRNDIILQIMEAETEALNRKDIGLFRELFARERKQRKDSRMLELEYTEIMRNLLRRYGNAI